MLSKEQRTQLKLFALISKWDAFYQSKGKYYTPSDKKLAEGLEVSIEEVREAMKILRSKCIIDALVSDDGYRYLVSAI